MSFQITSLPPEILCHIFSFNPKHELCSYELTCKHFSKLLCEQVYFPEINHYKMHIAEFSHKCHLINRLPSSNFLLEMKLFSLAFSINSLVFTAILPTIHYALNYMEVGQFLPADFTIWPWHFFGFSALGIATSLISKNLQAYVEKTNEEITKIRDQITYFQTKQVLKKII